MNLIRRTIHPETRVLDSERGLVEYVASDETLDSYKEVIRVNGWRFDMFKRNAPFVDSHKYDSLECLIGKVVDFKTTKIKGKPALVETVQWAIDVPEQKLAQVGFRLTEAGYLKAVSVGFWPVKVASKYDDPNLYSQQLLELGMDEANGPRSIYLEQQQIELSSCIIGANPNALAKARRDGLLLDADLDAIQKARLVAGISTRGHSTEALRCPECGAEIDPFQEVHQEQQEFLRSFECLVESI